MNLEDSRNTKEFRDNRPAYIRAAEQNFEKGYMLRITDVGAAFTRDFDSSVLRMSVTTASNVQAKLPEYRDKIIDSRIPNGVVENDINKSVNHPDNSNRSKPMDRDKTSDKTKAGHELLTISEIVKMFPYMSLHRSAISAAGNYGSINREKVGERQFRYQLDEKLIAFCQRYEKKKAPVSDKAKAVSKSDEPKPVTKQPPAVLEKQKIVIEDAPAKVRNGRQPTVDKEIQGVQKVVERMWEGESIERPEEIIRRPKHRLNTTITALTLARLRGAGSEEIASVEKAYDQASSRCQAFSRSLRTAARELDRNRRRHRRAILIRKLFGV